MFTLCFLSLTKSLSKYFYLCFNFMTLQCYHIWSISITFSSTFKKISYCKWGPYLDLCICVMCICVPILSSLLLILWFIYLFLIFIFKYTFIMSWPWKQKQKKTKKVVKDNKDIFIFIYKIMYLTTIREKKNNFHFSKYTMALMFTYVCVCFFFVVSVWRQ